MNSKQRNSLISVILVLVVAVAVAVSGRVSSGDEEKTSSVSADSSSVMTVTFVDVGQGDCEFIEFPNGECMLIDSGEKYYSDEIEEKISQAGYSKIDYLVATHPHTDHMGGMSSIIEDFDIGEIYMPYATSNTKAFEDMLTAIDGKGLTINTAKAGTEITFTDDITGEFLAPVSDSYQDTNDYSAVLKLTYNDVSFLFTGDAGEDSEAEMLENSYSSLDADVLKVGHHGSKYSTCDEFLDAVSPEYAVIECGEDNRYGHPHSELTDRLDSRGITYYRTDMNGSITFVTDGIGIDASSVLTYKEN